MLAIKGVYKNGKLSLQKEIKTTKSVNVIVTFLEEIEPVVSQGVDLRKFSFDKSRQLLKDYKGSFSDAVIEERRNEL
ncbi:MAG: hypothetical protein HZA78_09110 [Candidatus Schekmanbacteria bacterium]|nr:hypothetical protein [Candidatus Schekmanbacteria bacterium]